MEDKDYFNKVCLYRAISVLTPHLQWWVLSSSLPGERRTVTFSREIYVLLLRRWRAESFLCLLLLICLQLKTNMPKWDIWGYHILISFNWCLYKRKFEYTWVKREDQVGTARRHHLEAKERGLRRNHSCWHLDLRLLTVPRTVIK